jgi:hypothetical protein
MVEECHPQRSRIVRKANDQAESKDLYFATTLVQGHFLSVQNP